MHPNYGCLSEGKVQESFQRLPFLPLLFTKHKPFYPSLYLIKKTIRDPSRMMALMIDTNALIVL